MGDRESFAITPTFFNNANEWSFTGKGKVTFEKLGYYDYDENHMNRPMFHVQEGSVVFHKKNFHPNGELRLIKPNIYSLKDNDIEDPFSVMYFDLGDWCYTAVDDNVSDERRRILKNLPFAYRGYIFKTKSLQKYFESTKWYIPNPEYNGSMEGMTHRENHWVDLWKN